MTHDDLVVRAERWLRNSAWVTPQYPVSDRHVKSYTRCSVVLTEPSGASEQPDAIGWCNGGRTSLLIECKASRSDFAADQKKWHRRASLVRYAMGTYRFYMTPCDLLKPEEMPYGWGLLEIAGRRVDVIQQSDRHERGVTDEMNVLWSECRKIQFVEKGGTLNTVAGRRITKAVENTHVQE